MKLSTLIPAAGCILLMTGCVRGENLTGLHPSRGGTPRDQYALDAGATATPAEVDAWERASERALRSGLRIAPSFHERVRFPMESPQAVAYRFSLARGQSLRVRVTSAGGERIFADMFQTITSDMFRHVYAARRLDFEFSAPVDGEYVLRLQPPLRQGGLFDVTVHGNAPLLFPVSGSGRGAIGSVYGDPRDGGVRLHEGVDIFAPRGTPVLAVTGGIVNGVRTTPVGGRVVWLSDAARPLTYYYAHLEEQWVRDGEWVSPGDTLGTVGNSGNAITTPPHLHFGIYQPGTIPLDPAPFLASAVARPVATEDQAAPPLIETMLLGQRVSSTERLRLHSSPSHDGRILGELDEATSLLVLGGVRDWQRVVLDDGTTGFVSARLSAATAARSR